MKSIDQLQESIYKRYFKLEKTAYLERISFFEAHHSEIYLLDLLEQVELRIDYALALFFIESHQLFLNNVDELLELIIVENIYEFDGVDIYKDLLLKKAKSAHATLDYHKAGYVLNELAKMDTANELVKAIFIKNDIEKSRYENQLARSISIGLFFASAIIIAVEILYVRSFKSEWTRYFEITRNSFFFLAIFNVVFQEIRIRYLANKKHKKLR